MANEVVRFSYLNHKAYSCLVLTCKALLLTKQLNYSKHLKKLRNLEPELRLIFPQVKYRKNPNLRSGRTSKSANGNKEESLV